MFFFPVVSTKESEVMSVFVLYGRRKWKSYRSLRQENVLESHFFQHLPRSKDARPKSVFKVLAEKSRVVRQMASGLEFLLHLSAVDLTQIIPFV